MSEPKIPGACTCCDKPLFEVKTIDPDTKRARQITVPTEDACRLLFVLKSGSQMDLTFCAACADSLAPAQYPFLWSRVMRSWIAEAGVDHPTVKEQSKNSILGIVRRQKWTEVWGYERQPG